MNFVKTIIYLCFRVGQQLQINSEYNEELIDNFNYTTSDAIFCEQPPPYSQLSVSIFPVKYYPGKNQMIMSMIFKPRDFFLVSSIIYFIWGVLAFVVTIVLTTISSMMPYFSLW